jgi:hypothetical protein
MAEKTTMPTVVEPVEKPVENGWEISSGARRRKDLPGLSTFLCRARKWLKIPWLTGIHRTRRGSGVAALGGISTVDKVTAV